MSIQFKGGYQPSSIDDRDYLYSSISYSTTKLPSYYFMDRIPINEQVIGDCVGQSARSIKHLQEKKNHPTKNYDFAPDFVYSECKKIDGKPNQEGTDLRSAFKVLKDLGIARKGQYPDLTVHNQRPQATQTAYQDAKQFIIGAYAQCTTLEDIKRAIFEQGAVMGGLLLCDNFLTPESGGFIDLPEGSIIGGHAIAFDGWDDAKTHKYKDGTVRKGFLRFINSWGEKFGDKGYGYLPYDYFYYKTDLGMRFFQEAYSSVDVIMPDSSVKVMTMWLDSKKAIVNGKETILEVAPYASKEGRTMVPLRFMSENLGFSVAWDDKERRIDIYR